MKIVFFGSDDFAVTNLEHLLKSRHKVLACVTQPDRAKGRGMQLTSTEVKDLAVKKKIDILQPTNLADNNFIKRLKSFDADLFVVVAYGQILPEAVLSIPKIFCVNVHASLLPKYRGAAPINWAIINGDNEVGVTVFKLAKSVDSGEIISQKSLPILESDTSVTLRTKTATFGVELFMGTLDSIEQNTYTLTKQDSSKISCAPKLTKDQGLIEWRDSAYKIYNLVRGLLPWPGAYCYYAGKRLKILETKVVDLEHGELKPGQIADISKRGFIVTTGKNGLLIMRVLLESSKEMDAQSFIAGQRLKFGFKFE